MPRTCHASGVDGSPTLDGGFGERRQVIPYTAEAWATLERLSQATVDTYAALRKLFAAPERLALAKLPPMLVVGGDAKEHA